MATNKPRYPTEEELKRQGYSPAQIEAIISAYDAERREKENKAATTLNTMGKGFKKGGRVKSSVSKRADGVAKKGKTRGRVV